MSNYDYRFDESRYATVLIIYEYCATAIIYVYIIRLPTTAGVNLELVNKIQMFYGQWSDILSRDSSSYLNSVKYLSYKFPLILPHDS
jgi:hypothetical protein